MPDESLIWAPLNDVGETRAPAWATIRRASTTPKAARLIGWLRLRPKPGSGVASLKLAWVGINAVAVDQRTTLEGRVLGVSTGAADQLFQLPAGSVDADSLQVRSSPAAAISPGRWDDLAAISADAVVAREAAAFELDAEAGTLRFGDGVRGRVPERQMRIRLARALRRQACRQPAGGEPRGVSSARLVGAPRALPAIRWRSRWPPRVAGCRNPGPRRAAHSFDAAPSRARSHRRRLPPAVAGGAGTDVAGSR